MADWLGIGCSKIVKQVSMIVFETVIYMTGEFVLQEKVGFADNAIVMCLFRWWWNWIGKSIDKRRV